MKTKEVNDSIDKLNVDTETKKGILELIDLKIENDMEKVINKIEQFQNQNHSEFKIMNSEIKRLEDKQDAKSSIILWAIGILIALIIGMRLL